MLVSAVSANHFQSNRIAENSIVKTKSVQADNNTDVAFNSLNPLSQKSASIERLSLYESINEWKDFCHKQIMDGKLNIIA